MNFDGNGNFVVEGATSSSAGLQFVSPQKGAYGVSGTTMSFENVLFSGLSLDGAIDSPGQISVTRHNGFGSTIVVEK